jgi:glycosyltransferase involved in cell wall biosynthesis
MHLRLNRGDEGRHVLSDNLQSEARQLSHPKLVRIIARLSVGGAAQQVCMLHEKLLPTFDTYLITGSLADGEHDMGYLLSSERNVLRLPRMSREISFLSDAVTFWKIYRFLRKVRPSIVHTHTAKAGALGRFAAWLAGVPVIVHTYHGHVFHGYFGPTTTRAFLSVERLLGRISTRIIAISESQWQDLALKYRIARPEKISVVNNGFDLSRFTRGSREEARIRLGISADEFVVAWVGRLVPVKDVELLASVVRKAADSSRKFRFLVVGDGTERAKLESLTAGCGNVNLLGWRADTETIWRAADAALLTSRNEGTPTALIEAMAACVPFVATNVGAVQDVAVGESQELPNEMGLRAANGFLAARTQESLTYCLETLASDRQLAKKMGEQGYAFVMERFSTSRLMAELTELYHALMEGKPELVSRAAQPATEGRSKAADAI